MVEDLDYDEDPRDRRSNYKYLEIEDDSEQRVVLITGGVRHCDLQLNRMANVH